jgi:cell division septum initiation protein DivIVA
MRGRVKGLLAGTPLVPEPVVMRSDAPPPDPISVPHAQREALQVLTLAQRTADEHIANAHHQADKIHADAQATAEQIVREAEAHAEDLREEADDTLADARATAAQLAQEAQAQVDEIRRNADKILADARARAAEIAKNAQAHADELKHQAEHRYQDVVGSLATKREALQQQIEALEQFDHDYRARLTTFMQSQLRALWVDEPQAGPEIEQPEPATTGGLVPAQRND